MLLNVLYTTCWSLSDNKARCLSNYNMLPWLLKRVGILIKQIDCAKLNFDLKQCLELTTAFEREVSQLMCSIIVRKNRHNNHRYHYPHLCPLTVT